MAEATALPPAMHVFERGWLSANNILFTGAGDATLIDTGYFTHITQTLALVEHQLAGRPLQRVINTHLHSDHCGGNAALHERYGSKILVPAAEAAKVRAWDEDALSFKATGQQCMRFDYDDVIHPGSDLQLGGMHWQALAAPGHDQHSLIFYCPSEKILISADALWYNGFGVVFPELDGESGYAEARATLELIGTLDVRLVIPGHGAPFGDMQGALKRAFKRLDFLEEDPARNAENAVKVMLKFLLLSRQEIAMDEVYAMFATMPLMVGARERYLGHVAATSAALADWTVHSLVRAGVAKRGDGMLINREF